MAKNETIDIITIGQVTPIIDNLNSNRTDAALSANMGKKLNDEKYLIKYIDIGNTSVSTDILTFAISAEPGFYRSVTNENLFSNLPISISSNSFTLEIQSTSQVNKTLLLRPSNTNDVFVNIYTNNTWTGWKLIDQTIKYTNIGSTDTSIDILEWALTVGLGFYRSINTGNLFTNIPNNKTKGAFELEIGSISSDAKYRTLKLKYFDSNDIYINTNKGYNSADWSGWTLLINDSNPKNVIYKKVIETKEQFNTINFNENAIYYIKNFNTIFSDNGIKPTPFNYGYLEVMTRTSNEAWLTYTPYRILDGAKLVTRANNGILENWTYENNFKISNKGNIAIYGIGDGTDNNIKFYDYTTGTVNCSVFDGTAHLDYNGVVIKNDKANTFFTLENDKNVSFTVDNNKMPITLNPFIYKNNYTYITGSQNTINKAGTKGGVEYWYVDGDGGGKPIGTPMGASHVIQTYTALPDWWIQVAMDFPSGQLQTRASNGNSNNPTQWATLFSTINTPAVNLGEGNGYMIMQNGLILQFGRVVLTPNANIYRHDHNYHIPFKFFSNVYCTRSWTSHSPSSLSFVCWEYGVSKFQIHIETSQLNQADVYYWFAIGI